MTESKKSYINNIIEDLKKEKGDYTNYKYVLLNLLENEIQGRKSSFKLKVELKGNIHRTLDFGTYGYISGKTSDDFQFCLSDGKHGTVLDNISYTVQYANNNKFIYTDVEGIAIPTENIVNIYLVVGKLEDSTNI